jgi:monoamine oxidase
VTTNRGDFAAARAIVTLPIGVLGTGAVTFDPPLPPSKIGAIERLGAAVLDKLYLRFPKSFWPDNEVFGRIGPPHGEVTGLYNLEPSFGEPVLMCLHGGSTARRIETLTDEALVAMAVTRLREMFGAAVVEPEAIIATRWHADPFARGSYSYLPPRATPDDRDALAEPIGHRVFFAGEATDRNHPSTIRGALASGRRAAKRILAR